MGDEGERTDAGGTVPRAADPGRVLITGGSGLIGRALTAELAAAGYEVVVLSRRPGEVGGLPAGARAAGWDGETAEGWWQLAEGARGIVHLAGASLFPQPWTARRKRVLHASRVESSRAVVAAIERCDERPAVLLQASGIDYYGPTGEAPVTEEHPPGDGFLSELCVAWEAASAPAEALGVRRAVLRTSVVLAREGGALPLMALPFRLFVGGRLGSGDQYFPWIHRADEAGAIRFLLEHDRAAGAFNLVAPQPVTNRELSREIARALGRPNLLRVPRLALHATLGEMADSLLGGQRALPAKLRALGYRFRFPELPAALADLLGPAAAG